MATTTSSKRIEPPSIMGYRMDPGLPLHQLAAKRIYNNRDLKIIITAEDSQTGVGKTTLAGWLAMNWTQLFTDREWFVDPDEYGVGMGTLNPREYFSIIQKVPTEYPAGTAVIVDDAEELDARRSMQNLNVDFSQRWMLMRLKQAITIITLPSPGAIDSRLEELSDVWINVQRRGRALVHDIRVQSYGSRNTMTEKVHEINFPNVSEHPQLQILRAMKQEKMDDWDEEEAEEQEQIDPDEVVREEKIEIAQRMRDDGMSGEEIGAALDRSDTWVYNVTEANDD